MRRFLVELEYNGKNFYGWQALPEHRTVQGVVEQALYELFGKTSAVGCSRTDAGVSASQYFFHFDAETGFPADRICHKLNRFLPADCQAQSSIEVTADFDARRDCVAKTYEYALYAGDIGRPLLNATHYRIVHGINVDAMRDAAARLVGTHDFSAFRAHNADCKSATRTVLNATVVSDGCAHRIRITADGFLYKMMRNVAGCLALVGKGKLAPEAIDNLLQTGERGEWMTLPAKGLRLVRVSYDPDHLAQCTVARRKG